MSEITEAVILMMKPGQSAEKILVSDLLSFIDDLIGENIQQLEFAGALIVYDGNARKRGELLTSIISGETLVGNILCLQQISPVPAGLDDNHANELLKYGCFQKEKPITMSKYFC